MKKTIALLSGVVALTPMGALHAADTASADLNMSAVAPNTCYIRSITQTGENSENIAFQGVTQGGASVTGSINYGTTLADPVTANARASTINLDVSAYCNYASHSVTISSLNGGLVGDNQSATVGTFHRRITYDATLNWNGAIATLDATGDKTSNQITAASSGNTVIGPAVNGVAQLRIVTDADTVPLLQGTYADTLTIRFSPSL